MKHLNTSRKMSRVFQGLVLTFALLLVACGGGDADDPTPTATSGADQSALPTVPPVESTPDSTVSEDEITVLAPEIPATPEASPSTPGADEADVSEETEASPEASPVDLTTPMETEEAESETEATPPADDEATTHETEEPVEEDESSTEPTVRARTGDETFDHPGDGTGGSGMPGERNTNVGDEEVAEATPAASPVAQLSIVGCEVPDIPGFIGDTSTHILLADVNFRSGPGVDCDPVIDEPLGDGQIVEVTGGPVTQEGDGSEWVQIDIDGTPGWITTDFIEPTE